MKNVRVKIVYLLLICIMLSVVVPFYEVQASPISDFEEWTEKQITELLDYCATKVGAFTSDNDMSKLGVGSWIYVNRAEKLSDLYNTFKAGVSSKNGKVFVSTDAMNALKKMTDSYITDCGDFYYAPTFSFQDVSSYTNKFSTLVYNRFLQDVKNEWTFICFSNSTYRYMHVDSDQIYFVGAPSVSYAKYVYFTDLNGDYTLGELTSYYLREYSSSVVAEKSDFGYRDRISFPHSDYPDNYRIITPDGRSVKVWNTAAALRAYLRGNSSGKSPIYVSSTYNNYNVNNDNSLEINNEILNEYIFNDNSTYTQDVTQVVNNITNVVNNYYTTNGSTMTQEDIQAAIDKALEDFLNSLPSGGGEESSEPETPTETETETETGTGGIVSGNDVSGNGIDGPLTVGWLEKIHNKLNEILEYLDNKILDALKDIKKAIVGNVLVDVGDSVAGLIQGGVEAVKEFVSDAASAFEPVADAMSQKFPTCIPWDLISIFSVMTVATRSNPAPVFEFPFQFERLGINETVTLDMAMFEPVSNICRTILSLLFVLLLIQLTIKLTMHGGDE